MLRQDYIIRIVKQVAEAIARMAGLRDKSEYQAALKDAESACDLLGVPKDLAVALDTETLAGLLRHPDKMRLLAKVFTEEAEVYRASGDPLTCSDRYRRAAELTLEARAADPQDDDASVLQELFRHFPTSALASKYRSPCGSPS